MGEGVLRARSRVSASAAAAGNRPAPRGAREVEGGSRVAAAGRRSRRRGGGGRRWGSGVRARRRRGPAGDGAAVRLDL